MFIHRNGMAQHVRSYVSIKSVFFSKTYILDL
jgi:hypothetical protein